MVGIVGIFAFLLGALAFLIRERESVTVFLTSTDSGTKIIVTGLVNDVLRTQLSSTLASAYAKWPATTIQESKSAGFGSSEEFTGIPTENQMNQLIRMADLRDRGALSEGEFEKAKNAILGPRKED